MLEKHNGVAYRQNFWLIIILNVFRQIVKGLAHQPSIQSHATINGAALGSISIEGRREIEGEAIGQCITSSRYTPKERQDELLFI